MATLMPAHQLQLIRLALARKAHTGTVVKRCMASRNVALGGGAGPAFFRFVPVRRQFQSRQV
ncbi:MAG: hypothetical protein CMJ59_24150 [Planctomycetaceae bacterium]|nr:hypothetical protein [Planctomycetaceae bacterium]